MTSALRLSIMLVLMLATAALGLIAYNAYLPKPVEQTVAQAVQAPPTSAYLVAAHPLPAGTLARDEDFTVRSAAVGEVPAGAILDTPDAKAGLRGSLVRRYLDAGVAVTSDDVLRPRDRGFLASVLAPDTRAVSIKVDAESGVSGLIWPGDYVDVVLTQANDKADSAHRTLSEAVLHNVRIIAIDQDIVQGADGKDATAGRETHSVSLQLQPDEVKSIAVAKDLGKLSLAVRSAVGRQDVIDSGTVFGCHVSQEMARQSAIASRSTTVVVYAGDKPKEFSVQKHDAAAGADSGCDVSSQMASRSPPLASLSGR
ncbi:MAG TPA: Flp pilus assembly protein CpaB [Roseiarcus sp.]|nr:Flp pilus assembly protein CpaB [Roseiarcus sp.]